MHVAVRDPGQLFQEGSHLLRAERAVDPDCQGPRVLDGQIERLHGLPRERAPAFVHDGDRNHDGKPNALLFEDVLDCAERGFGIQGVENRFDQQQVDSTVEEATHLLRVCFTGFVECERPVARIIDVGTETQGLVEWTDRASDVAIPVRAAGGRFLGKTCGSDVELVHDPLQFVVRLRERVRVERVGLDDVCASIEVLFVNPTDHVRPRENQQVVVALQAARVVDEAVAAKISLSEARALDHRAHRTVEKNNPLLD